jgi:hypothetical protein
VRGNLLPLRAFVIDLRALTFQNQFVNWEHLFDMMIDALQRTAAASRSASTR